ncbi:MAG: glucose dehydrogenase [Halioglobus sp.]|jgi:glucose dehydrogenase
MTTTAVRNLLLVVVAAIAVFIYASKKSDETLPQSEAVEETSNPAEVRVVELVNDELVKQADSEPGTWLSNGHTYKEQGFSPLDQINRDTVDQLNLTWAAELLRAHPYTAVTWADYRNLR